MKTLGALVSALAIVVTGSVARQPERVLRLEELTYTDIDQLDRNRTIFILTFGNLEEHGPHLPVGSDYFQAIAFRDGVVERLSKEHPDRTFVIAPVVPIGEGGANDVAGQPEHVGTFSVRFETLRDVAIDLGSAIAQQGFGIILLVHFHGSPLHSVAFNDAAGYVSDRYKARMVNLTSLVFGEQGVYSTSVMEKHLRGASRRCTRSTYSRLLARVVTAYSARRRVGQGARDGYRSVEPRIRRSRVGPPASRHHCGGVSGAAGKTFITTVVTHFVSGITTVVTRLMPGTPTQDTPVSRHIISPATGW